MLNVRLARDHLYGKLLFTWLSLVMSMMVSFCAVLFPTWCLGVGHYSVLPILLQISVKTSKFCWYIINSGRLPLFQWCYCNLNFLLSLMGDVELDCFDLFIITHCFMPRHKKGRGIMLYPPNFWVSVRSSVLRLWKGKYRILTQRLSQCPSTRDIAVHKAA